jgi:hypothetical protein
MGRASIATRVALTCQRPELRRLTREAFELIGSAVPHRAQCARLRRK